MIRKVNKQQYSYSVKLAGFLVEYPAFIFNMEIKIEPNLTDEQIKKVRLCYDTKNQMKINQLNKHPLQQEIRDFVNIILRPQILEQQKKQITGNHIPQTESIKDDVAH